MAGSNGLIFLGIAAVVIGVAFWKRCEIEFLKPLCDGTKDLDQKIKEFNSKPTLLQNPKTNDYRSTTMTKVKLADRAKELYEQNSLKPGTKGADEFAAYLKNTGYKPPTAKFANSLYSATPENVRLAI